MVNINKKNHLLNQKTYYKVIILFILIQIKHPKHTLQLTFIMKVFKIIIILSKFSKYRKEMMVFPEIIKLTQIKFLPKEIFQRKN